jgi:hypothetical protein
MSSSYLKWQQDTLRCLQRECLFCLAVVHCQGLFKTSGEIDHLSFSFIDLYVPVLTSQIHCSESLLQFAENMTFVFLCRVNTGIIHEQSKMSNKFWGGIIYV